MDDMKGAFFDSLKRNNKQIREDRALTIAEDAQTMYKRAIEDLELDIRKMTRELDNMLDLSPSNAQSLILASDFDPNNYVGKDIELALKIHNQKKKLEIAKERYDYLFGGEE